MKVRHVQSTEKIFAIFEFLQYINKKYCSCFGVPIEREKYSDTLRGSSYVCCYLFKQIFQLS